MMHPNADAHYQRGLEAQDGRDIALAIREFRQAVEIDPKHARAFQQLGWVIYGQGNEKNFEEARSLLESAIDLDPSLGDAHLYLAVVLCELGRLNDAEAPFRMALSHSEDPALVHTTFADNLLSKSGRFGEAEEHFEAALTIEPDLVLALRDYARMLASHGRDAEAKGLFVRALELEPDNRFTTRAYENFQRSCDSEDRDPDAWLREAIAEDPHYTRGIECLRRREIP